MTLPLIELCGCAERFKLDRGDPGTTLARLDGALWPVVRTRLAHVHPETMLTTPPFTPRNLGVMIERVKTAIGNLDSDMLGIEAPDQIAALNKIMIGASRRTGCLIRAR